MDSYKYYLSLKFVNQIFLKQCNNTGYFLKNYKYAFAIVIY